MTHYLSADSLWFPHDSSLTHTCLVFLYGCVYGLHVRVWTLIVYKDTVTTHYFSKVVSPLNMKIVTLTVGSKDGVEEDKGKQEGDSDKDHEQYKVDVEQPYSGSNTYEGQYKWGSRKWTV